LRGELVWDIAIPKSRKGGERGSALHGGAWVFSAEELGGGGFLAEKRGIEGRPPRYGRGKKT